MKYLPLAILLACSHRGKSFSEKLVGHWYTESGCDISEMDQDCKTLMHRKANGEFSRFTKYKSKRGKPHDLRLHGFWGVSGRTYFTVATKAEFEETTMTLKREDPGASTVNEIIGITDDSFVIYNADQNITLTYKKVSENFKIP